MSLVIVQDETPSTGMPGAIERGDQSTSAADSTALSNDMASLEALSPAEAEIAVTRMLDQSRQWIIRAREFSTPAQDIADFKAFVSTVAEAAKQKKMSEDIQMDATEMVRRSERALGVAIRDGQAAGEIRTAGENIGPRADYERNGSTVRVDPVFDKDKVSPKSFFANPTGTEVTQTYTMAAVTDEEFEVAISVAKEEGNLSRVNVVRKVAEVVSFEDRRAEQWEQVADFASRGFTSSQIAKTIGLSEQHLRKLARDRGVVFPADKIVGARRIDSLKVIEKCVASYEASADALDLVTYEDVTPELAVELLERLQPGLAAIRRLAKQLNELKEIK